MTDSVVTYVDTSALARAYLADEDDHRELRRRLLDAPGVRLLSSLTALEMAAVLHRAERAGRIDAAADFLARFDADCSPEGRLAVVRTDLGVLRSTVRRLLREHSALRSLDAVQLAVAVRIAESGARDVTVVTRDDRQAGAARAEGLRVDDGRA